MLSRRKKSGPKQAMTPDRLDRLRALSAPDRNQWFIAQQLGVAPSTVGKWQRKLGLPRPARGEQCELG